MSLQLGPQRRFLSMQTTSAFWGTPDSLCSLRDFPSLIGGLIDLVASSILPTFRNLSFCESAATGVVSAANSWLIYSFEQLCDDLLSLQLGRSRTLSVSLHS
jgi:hypothetical protein